MSAIGIKEWNAEKGKENHRRAVLEVTKAKTADVPGSRLELIENAGHFPWLEQPERFYALLDSFLTKATDCH